MQSMGKKCAWTRLGVGVRTGDGILLWWLVLNANISSSAESKSWVEPDMSLTANNKSKIS